MGDKLRTAFGLLDVDFTAAEAEWFRRGDDMYEATHRQDGTPHCTTPKNENQPANPPNPKQRFGDMKAAVQLVPPALTIHAAKAYKEGAQKYGAFNWRITKVESMTYIAGMMRHLMAYLDGEEIDPESSTGKHHLDGVAASLGILLDAMDGGFLIDNRPPKGPAPGLLRLPESK